MIFLISLVIIIIMHEAAHLITAKHCKCGVEIFSIGFGPALFKKKLGGTVYQISPFLLGGFCKLKGELDATKEQDAFVNLPYNKKFAIVVAGCAVNVIFGALIMALGLRLQNYSLWYFGYLSIALGATNWFLPIPCLDGGYALWYPLLLKIYGTEKGTKIFAKAVRISFIIVMTLNIACIPYLIKLLMRGGL